MNNTLCNLCPNNCNVNRSNNVGFCGQTNDIKIAKYYLHKFEEPIISGTNGSGTIFFVGCSLKCVFCQNYELSRSIRGKTISPLELANIFKELEDMGAHNINLVTPSHFNEQIIEAFSIYKPKIPVVYNTHAYENLHALEQIDPFIDVYLPDLKFFGKEISKRYCGKENYFKVASNIIRFMAKKPIKFNDDGLLTSGTVVRHLVLPQNVSDSKRVLDFLAELKDNIFVSVLSQYTPFGDVKNFPELNRKLTKREYDNVINYAIFKGFEKMFYQNEKSADTSYIPSWDF